MALWSLQGTKILVIDDYSEMRSMLRNILTSFGAEDITPAANGEDAIELMNNKHFNIVLCDYNLGDGKDGQQVLEEVKLRNRLPHSSVFIMVTAESTAHMVIGALEHQPDEYLSKPVTRTVLQTRLRKLLEKKEELSTLYKHLDNKNIGATIALCDEFISNKRYRLELMRLKTNLLIDNGQYEEAQAACEQALEEREMPWATFNLGKICFFNAHYEEARKYFENVIIENKAFIAAYDWLAKTCVKLNDQQKAQKALQDGVDWSPKSVVRQRTLAEIAEGNEDYQTAELARKKAIRLGKNSITRKPADYTHLARTLLKNGNPKDAMRYLDVIKHEFKDDEQAKLAAATTKSKIYKEMGQSEKSEQALAEAMEMLSSAPNLADNETALELTESCLALGRTEDADNVLSHLLNNNHDDDELIAKANDIYVGAGIEQGAQELVSNAQKEMIAINNHGVKLINEGHIEESIGYFEKALEVTPHNSFLNINTAQAYLMKMKKRGKDPELLHKARIYLEKAHNDNKLLDRHKVLSKLYWNIANT
ncbi:tetratricopeptide repeat protein [Pseudomonadota bacterium]